jgi:hypothetical protein
MKVWVVEVRGREGQSSYRYLKARDAGDAASQAGRWEVEVLRVLPEPLSTEARARVGRRPNGRAESAQS